MARKGQRTGIFDLEDVTEAIQLPSFEGTFKEEDTILITPPKLMIDVAELHEGKKSVEINSALLIVKEQMRLSGVRKATISEYIYTFNRLVDAMKIEYVDDIKLESIFGWLASLGDISDISKQSRLRVIKAVLNRLYDNGWIERNFWKDVRIRVDTKIKLPADEKQLSILLSLLDMANFIQFRDAVAILTIYKTGIRMNTLIQLEERHIDFKTNSLLLTGDIMKNHDVLKLPFDDELATYLKRLIAQNNIIRKHYKKRNEVVFLSKFGDSLDVETKPCAITKRLSYYAKKYKLNNISAHAIRRLYATNLRKKGADVVLISKALSHKSLSTTTRYLGISSDDVLKGLRDYL